MSRNADVLREDARLRALRLIAANPHITQRELARELGISLGATHYMLRALVETDLVILVPSTQSEGKQSYSYVLTSKGLTEKALVAARFFQRKRNEYDALRAEIEDLSAELGKVGLTACDHQACSKPSKS